MELCLHLGGTYEEGSTVNVTAIPNSEYIFQNWSNGSTDNPLTVTVNENITLTANFIEIPSIQVYTNTISVSTENQNIEDILRTFYDPNGVFSYTSGGSMYTFYPGVADWFPGQNGSTSSINEVSSHILKKEGDIWVYHQNDLDANFWGMRNFEILGSEVIMGDGNEIGVEPSDWKGDAYIGEIIENGDINWRKVNGQEEMGFFHGIGAGDLNNDGLTDVGVTPGIDHNGINIFLQNSDGSFIRNDEILNFDEGSTGIPFTLDFADLDNDGLDEIITADYGGGSIPDEDDHEIRIYKYDDSTNRFDLHFQINGPHDAPYYKKKDVKGNLKLRMPPAALVPSFAKNAKYDPIYSSGGAYASYQKSKLPPDVVSTYAPQEHNFEELPEYTENRVYIRDFSPITDSNDPRLIEIPTIPGRAAVKLHILAAIRFHELQMAAIEAGFPEPLAASGWRRKTYATREQYNAAMIANYGSVAEGRKWVAYQSPHMTGLAVDFGNNGLYPRSATNRQQKQTPFFKWLVKNAHRFGFTPYKREAWHWEAKIPKESYASGDEFTSNFQVRVTV